MRLSIVILMFILSASCSYVPKLDEVLPDKRTEYKKSESLPDLEVPPDLTSDAIGDAMRIPGEDTGSASLTRYQQKQTGQPAQTSAPVAVAAEDEQWVSINGSTTEIWPRLREYFTGNGYTLELDDAELGVLETSWSEPVSDAGLSYRHKFKILSEPGGEAGNTILFISNARQQLIDNGDGTNSWVDREKSIDAEKIIAGELNVFFNASTITSTGASITQAVASETSVPAESRRVAELMNTEDGKQYLAIPHEFTYAWRKTEIAMQRAGLAIASKDIGKGIYYINYYDAVESEKKGWMSKLKFWGDDDSKGILYQVSLTGVGNKTELIIMNEADEWETNEDAVRIISLIQGEYNKEL